MIVTKIASDTKTGTESKTEINNNVKFTVSKRPSTVKRTRRSAWPHKIVALQLAVLGITTRSYASWDGDEYNVLYGRTTLAVYVKSSTKQHGDMI